VGKRANLALWSLRHILEGVTLGSEASSPQSLGPGTLGSNPVGIVTQIIIVRVILCFIVAWIANKRETVVQGHSHGHRDPQGATI